MIAVFVVILVSMIGSIVVFLLTVQLNKRSEQWISRKFFYFNDLAGRTAFCAISKYDSGQQVVLPSGRKLVAVPETFTEDDELRNISAKLDRHPFFVKNPLLFIPGTSETIMTKEEQGVFFVTPDNFQLQSVIDEVEERDADKWYRWGRSVQDRFYLLNKICICSIICLAVSIPALLIALIADIDVSAMESEVRVTLSDPVSGRATIVPGVTADNQHRQFLRDAEFVSSVIKGPVRQIQPIGGNLTLIGVECRQEGMIRYGIADSTTVSKLKPGDVVYLRNADLKLRQGKNTPRDCYFTTATNFLITQKEAESLLATGRFKLHE